jgi:putative cardiolipin synthase
VIDTNRAIYEKALSSEVIQDLLDDKSEYFPAKSRVITDDPDKLVNKISDDYKVLAGALVDKVDSASSEVVVITPYFIPRKNGVEFWRSITEKGVRVVILTNSLASNNHTPVHSAYARYRHDMLDAGVELYEIRVDASKTPEDDGQQSYDAVTLHTKALTIDRRHSFIGSLNLDPRSIEINTEIGVLIDNAELTSAMMDRFFENLPKLSYRVTEDAKGKLRWTVVVDGKQVVETKEPQTSAWMRFKAMLFRIFPEGQL